MLITFINRVHIYALNRVHIYDLNIMHMQQKCNSLILLIITYLYQIVCTVLRLHGADMQYAPNPVYSAVLMFCLQCPGP